MMLSDLLFDVNKVVKLSDPKPFNNATHIVITRLLKGVNYFIVDCFYFQNTTITFNTFYVKDQNVTLTKGPKTTELLDHAKKLAKISLKRSYYIGSDPEIFVTKNEGELFPAFEFLGSKQAPTITNRNPSGYGKNNCYWDGFQAEFDTKALNCLSYHIDSIQAGMGGVLDAARIVNPTAKLSLMPTFNVSDELLKNSKDEHVQFGCMPSKNAYGMEGLKADGRAVNFRSAGGHIHFGIGQLSEPTCIKLVKALDKILGVACVSLFAGYDDARRRQMYGLAGEYRTPAHGIEYRTLSNVWLCHPLITNVVFDTARAVVNAAGMNIDFDWQADELDVIRIINTNDVDAARAMLEQNKESFIKMMSCYFEYDNGRSARMLYNIFSKGIDAVIADPKNIEKNWNLGGGWVGHNDGKDQTIMRSIETLEQEKKVG